MRFQLTCDVFTDCPGFRAHGQLIAPEQLEHVLRYEMWRDAFQAVRMRLLSMLIDSFIKLEAPSRPPEHWALGAKPAHSERSGRRALWVGCIGSFLPDGSPGSAADVGMIRT